jgi:hypothetical protein
MREGGPFAVHHLRWQKNPKEVQPRKGEGLGPGPSVRKPLKEKKAMKDALAWWG